jgi:hypothetical protein
VIIFGGGVFGILLGHEGKALMSGVSAFIKDTPENSVVPFHHVRTR